ncbi:MAG: hypothetical protein GY941_22015 [Planctomycetes bacterium]|nr:hypothetical protein [Planctomycetota bacterium]
MCGRSERLLWEAIVERECRVKTVDLPLIEAMDTEDIEYYYYEIERHGAKDEIRCSGTPTNIPEWGSRHYETESVAAFIKGVWVGWTYYYGGGKHGEPEAFDWIGDSYLLEVTEEREVVTVERVFKKLED